MAHLFFIICILLIQVSLQSPVAQDHWIIWNVGQGQWITHVTYDDCRHFDFGGEIQYFKTLHEKFIKTCSRKRNLLYLSHADLDHYSFLKLLVHRSKSICWMVQPKQMKSDLSIENCSETLSAKGHNQTILVDCVGLDKNSCSTVFKRRQFLIPGDSPKSQEKKWLPILRNKTEISVLVLGHHGSKTSTHQKMIQMLPRLKLAVASARFKKYGHPHEKTQLLLRKFHIPLLRTEYWGNIVFR